MAGSLAFVAQPVLAQGDAVDESGQQAIEEIVVTGSRIRRPYAETAAPMTTIGEARFDERGYVSAAEALNEVTSIKPQLNQAPGSGDSSGPGQQFPDLFGLGTGRTLTLVNGRRFVTSSSGLGDAQVDANIIPIGLIDRIEVVQAGGAAVYGSDAIAGVVNYILKDDFEGFQFDAQGGVSDRGDYETRKLRATYGFNFADDRGNLAFNAEWSESPALFFADRDLTNLARVTQGNPDDTGPNDGIPSVREVLDTHFWNFNENGVIYNIPAPPPMFLTLVNGAPAQFATDGSVVPYNPGTILGIPFGTGGDGFRFSDLTGLRTAVDRVAVNAIGHLDFTDNLTGNLEFLYARTEGEEVPQGFSRTVLSPAPFSAIPFTNANPFLSADAIAALSAASPGFGAGAPLFLSRHFYYDLLPTNVETTTNESWRVLAGLDGEFDAANRGFYWSVSGSFGRVEGEERVFDVHNANFNNAIFAVPDGAGGAACLINVDGDPANDDPACAPINPFGFGNISAAATDYVSVMTGTDYTNEQIDILATIGTSLFVLPTGDVETLVAYEHRDEQVEFVPLPANQQGLTGVGTMQAPRSGEYDTDEFSFELLLPIVGNEFTLPFAQSVELNGSYRYVDNSLAGTEDVWGTGLRWQVVEDVVLRATRTRNFRAPTLNQLLAPTTVFAGSIAVDPCDADRINGGPNPAVRRANCEAEWAANPAYGSLDTFQDPAENFVVTQISQGGNPALRNEVADTTTYGIVLQPRFIPDLTIAVDRIEIDLTDGLSAFLPADFLAACYDAEPQPADICDTFTRLPMTDGTSPAGTIATALSTTFNAGVIQYEGEVYRIDYDVPMSDMFGGDAGNLSLTVEATHTSLLTESVTGTTFTRLHNTAEQPDWVTRFNADYMRGPLQLSYQLFYLSEVLAAPDATIETTPNPVLDSNMTHSLSGLYEINDNWIVRAGVVNLTDEPPSYPNFGYGDILGRRYFVGFTADF